MWHEAGVPFIAAVRTTVKLSAPVPDEGAIPTSDGGRLGDYAARGRAGHFGPCDGEILDAGGAELADVAKDEDLGDRVVGGQEALVLKG